MVLPMTQRLPSDTLKKPARRAPWIISIVGAAAIGTAAVLAGPSIAANLNPTPTPSPTVTDYVATLTPAELDAVQEAADQQAATIAAEKAAADAAAAAEAQAQADAAAKAAQHHSAAAGAPGSRVPFIASSDPNNANGGDYEDPGVYCQSHSASGNPPVCD
jgi:hypothetical protein